MSSPMRTTAGSRSISSYMACLMASRKVTWVIAAGLMLASLAAVAMGYRAAFRAVLLAITAAFAAFFAGAFAWRPLLLARDASSAEAASLACFSVSPKWIGALPPPDAFPLPKPFTVQTAATLDFGGVTSEIGRSHFGATLWQSSPVQ